MADNFNLRQFLSENKLTKNAKLLKEAVEIDGKEVDIDSIEVEGIDRRDHPDYVDAYAVAASFTDGTELSDDQLEILSTQHSDIIQDAIHDRQLYLQEEKDVVKEEVTDQGVDETVQETLTTKEKQLVEMVENALGIAPQAPVSEEEMVQEKPLPKYESIEKLMQEIDHGTNEAACKYKMNRMKEIAEMLEQKVGSLEEGEGADFVDAKKVKQMKRDISTLRKQAEKLEKEYEKKFGEKKVKKEEE